MGPLYEPYVQDFNKRYAPLQLETSYVTGDYAPLTQTQLAGGNVDYDVLFADDGYSLKWFNAGWVRALDDIPETKDVLADMDPGLESSCRSPEGKLVTLPYYRGVELFIYNKEHLSTINRSVPKTWDEFLDTARELKAKKVVTTPYSPFWSPQFLELWYMLVTEANSDGAGPFFDDNFKPLFADDPVVASTLERWKVIYKEGLVPADIFTTDYGGITSIFAGGKSSFTVAYGPELKGYQDPKNSTVAGKAGNVMLPGKTGTTISFGAWWMMTSSTPDPQTAWQLLRYLAWKDKDGQYYFGKNLLAKELGLQTAFSAVNNDPEVKASWATWSDADALIAQAKNSRSLGPVALAEWYPDFATNAIQLFQDAIRGTKPVPQAIKEAADYATSKI